MLDDELLAPGVLSSVYVSGVAQAMRGAWPLSVAGVYGIDDAHLAPLREGCEDEGRVPALSGRIRMEPYAKEELLACCIARLIGDAGHVAVGAASPIPATGRFSVQSPK